MKYYLNFDFTEKHLSASNFKMHYGTLSENESVVSIL
jgi:hypothetical protein